MQSSSLTRLFDCKPKKIEGFSRNRQIYDKNENSINIILSNFIYYTATSNLGFAVRSKDDEKNPDIFVLLRQIYFSTNEKNAKLKKRNSGENNHDLITILSGILPITAVF